MLHPLLGAVLAAAFVAGRGTIDSSWLLGDWLAEFQIGTQSKVMKIHCRKQENRIEAAIDWPPFGPTGVPVRKLQASRTTVSFEVSLEDVAFAFEGQLKDKGVSGEVRHGTDKGSFQMVRLATIDAARLAACRGPYQVGPGHFVWVAPFGELGAGLFFLDSRSGRFGPLYAESETTFFSGQAVVSPLFPLDIHVTFQRKDDGAVSTLIYQPGKAQELSGVKIALRREEVRFRNGAVTLAGTITTPAGERARAAIVLVHGSGPEDRDFLGPWVEFFASQGLTVLAYDKRGTGKSDGDWKKATFGDLAGDLEAGHRFLQARKNVDPRRVGLFAISQGGWIAPLAVRRSGDVAFTILHACSALTPGEQGLLSLESELRAYGFPQAEINEAVAYQKLDDAFTRTQKGWQQLQEAYQKAVSKKAEWVQPPRARDDWFRTFYRGVIDHDPSLDLQQVRCPVLAFFGDCDRTVPPERNKTALEQALAKGGNNDHTVFVLPRANHMFLQAQTGVRTEYSGLKNFVPRYFEAMSSWLKQRGLVEQ
jgi:pimeloyl-ACP methyl ester carboxylesterase